MTATAYKKFEVCRLNSSRYDEWDRFAESAPAGSIYSTARYLDVLCRAAGGNFEILAVLDNDQILGGIAVYHEHGWGLQWISPRLLLYYNGLVINECNGIRQSACSRSLAIVQALAAHLTQLRSARIVLNNRYDIIDVRPFISLNWTATASYTYTVPLTDLEPTWRRIDKNQRRLIRRASEAAVTFSDDDDFESFYALHEETSRRKGAALYLAKDKFNNFIKDLLKQGLAKIFNARMPDGNVVATQLVLLGAHPVSHTACAGARHSTLHIGVTPFLRWNAFKKLHELGYKENDLTDAGLNSVTQFKSHLGGELKLNLTLRRTDRLSFKALQCIRYCYSQAKRITTIKGL